LPSRASAAVVAAVMLVYSRSRRAVLRSVVLMAWTPGAAEFCY
jgi:hypothetical protein